MQYLPYWSARGVWCPTIYWNTRNKDSSSIGASRHTLYAVMKYNSNLAKANLRSLERYTGKFVNKDLYNKHCMFIHTN